MFCSFRQALATAGRKISSKPAKVHYGDTGPAGDLPKATLPIDLAATDLLGALTGPDPTFHDLAATLPAHLHPAASNDHLDLLHDLGLQDGLSDESSGSTALSDLTLGPSAQNFDSLPWAAPTPHISGLSVSLYDINPATGKHNGDPIADAFAALQYEDGAILACADGVNWGPKPKLAARSAIYGALKSLHRALGRRPATDTTQMFHLMLQAVGAAQQAIIQRGGTLTTFVLTVVARCPALKARYAVMTVAIGDTAALSFSASSGTLTDLTAAGRAVDLARDPRNCQGCLGYAMGEDPDLSNMTLSLSTAAPGDLILLATDGILDNFDPIMRKEAILEGGAMHIQDGVHLPAITPHDAHALSTDLMARTLRGAFAGQVPGAPPLVCAPLAVQALVGESIAITEEHRETVTRCSRRSVRKSRSECDILRELMQQRGKLDHATVVAFQCP